MKITLSNGSVIETVKTSNTIRGISSKNIKWDKTTKYLKAIKIGFDHYGLNGFYEMHEDICKDKNDAWGYGLEILNDLDNEDFKSLCDIYLKSTK